MSKDLSKGLIQKDDVVQFTEGHKWRGCLGIVDEVKDCGENGIRYMVGVPVPQERNCIYIYYG